MGVDPGTNQLGLAFMVLDNNFNIVRITSRTINPLDIYNHDLLVYTRKKDLDYKQRTNYICKDITTIIHSVEPDICSIETPFINMRRPMSFIVLQFHFDMVVNSITAAKDNIALFKYAPQSLKSSIGVSGKKGKEVVKNALIGIEEINKCMDRVNNMSEHEFDAVSACYCQLKRMRESKIV